MFLKRGRSIGCAMVSAATMVTGAPASAQLAPDAGAWAIAGDRVTASAANISLPTHAGSLALVQTGEASKKGSGLDAVAQYGTGDSEVFATAYIFMAAYPDAALASLATDRAIHTRFGADVTLSDERVVDAGGVPHAVIRRIYRNAKLGDGKMLVTAAAFVRTGRWMEVLRASGPAERERDIEAGLDALLAGSRFDGKDRPLPARPLTIAAPCPADERAATVSRKSKNDGANALIASLLGTTIPSAKESQPPMLSFPRNGEAPVCVRGHIPAGASTIDILQSVGADDAMRALILVDDAGGTLAVEPKLLGGGYQVKRYGIASIDVLGSYDTIPNPDQLGRILDGRDRAGAAVRSRTTMSADGNTEVQIDSDTLK